MATDTAPAMDAGSFRDPSGTVIAADGRVFRTIEVPAWEHADAVWSSGVLERLMASGQIIRTWPIELADAPAGLMDGLPAAPRRLVEHERIPFVSYPYEWPFSLLKRAALHHLDLHLALLGSGFTLSDASAYNIQFRGPRPVFIDVLSLRRYTEGEYWAGYRQFCEQFLNPLLLGALRGIPHAAWFRGTLEGIPVEDLARVLPLRARFSWRVYLHVVLHARMTASGRSANGSANASASTSAKRRPMSKSALTWMLTSLRRWIAGLTPRGVGETVWGDYAHNTSYAPGETEAKRACVARYVERRKPVEVMDLGCNTGDYSEVALDAGAERVVGFDVDQGALEGAVARADARRLDFLPLLFDALNPSPNQGWAQRERKGFQERAKADGLLALAFLHHVVIGRNVPLPQAVAWLAALAPSGVVEFVPKPDPMVQRMLAQREDIFPSYHIDAFRHELGRWARVVREDVVSSSGRTLFEYQR
jgi:ribosomal protein L11 methylase PrmA